MAKSNTVTVRFHPPQEKGEKTENPQKTPTIKKAKTDKNDKKKVIEQKAETAKDKFKKLGQKVMGKAEKIDYDKIIRNNE